MQFITILDYLLLPLYLGLIYFIANVFRNKYYPVGHPWRKYFMPGLSVKIFGAIFIGLVYQYYYGGGDTAYYFYQSKTVNSAFSESWYKGIMLILRIPTWYDGEYQSYISQMEWYGGWNTYLVISLAAVINIFTFGCFLPTSVIFAFISFSGIWALFRTFALQYPQYLRQVAVAILFIPSTFIWGSGIFKDTLCMFALGWMTYSVFQMLIQRNFSILNIFLSLMSFVILGIVKLYILLAFIPALALWVVFMYSHKIKSKLIRFNIKLILVGMTVVGFIVLSNQFSSQLGGYSLEKISKTAEISRSYVFGESSKNEGAGYDLGEIDPSIGGMLKILPISVATALFRPFIWEARKVIVLLNAIEASLFLIVTLKIFYKVGIKSIFKVVSSDPNIQFFLVFTFIFGFAVGLTSGNFGSLSRYRIPCLPMFSLALMLIYYSKFSLREKLFPFFNF